MSRISYIELGGTLFIPATHKDLTAVATANKYPELKSLLIDTEDGISQEDLVGALTKIKVLLQSLQRSNLLIFLRPRDEKVLATLLDFEGIEKIDGFILPKFSLHNANNYLSLLENTSFDFMPSIEGEELFNIYKLYQLKELLLTYKEQIILIRFGLEDMQKALKIKREPFESIFDKAALSQVVANLILTFKPDGFALSAGVYKYFNNKEGFEKEIYREFSEGLFSKTIIHPKQIKPLNKLNMPSQKEYEDALEILNTQSAVFNQNGAMAEKNTMSVFAQEIVLRKKIFGVNIFKQ